MSHGATWIRAAGLLAAALLAAGAAAAQEMPYRGDGHLMVTPADLEWDPIASLAGGARIAVIEGDLAGSGPFTLRLSLPGDYRLPPHTHPAYERVTVLSGRLFLGHGPEFDREGARKLGAGSVAFMAPGEPMFGFTEVPTVIQLHGEGPWGIRYVNAEDDPRN